MVRILSDGREFNHKTRLIQLYLWKHLYFASLFHMLGSIPVGIFFIPREEQGGFSADAQEGFLRWAELRARGVQCLAKEVLCCQGPGKPRDVWLELVLSTVLSKNRWRNRTWFSYLLSGCVKWVTRAPVPLMSCVLLSARLGLAGKVNRFRTFCVSAHGGNLCSENQTVVSLEFWIVPFNNFDLFSVSNNIIKS